MATGGAEKEAVFAPVVDVAIDATMAACYSAAMQLSESELAVFMINNLGCAQASKTHGSLL